MSGTITLSLQQQQNSATGEPLVGGTIRFYEAGTNVPQSAYQDPSLSISHPNPLDLDASGRVPLLYFADGYIKVVVRDEDGVTHLSQDYIPTLAPSSGSGAAPSVDTTTIFTTLDTKWRYNTGTHTGWVRCNGRTIGSASSGATERANLDCEDLFLALYVADTNLAVSGGRGASAAADWAANKTITLPDARGRTIAGMDDMGASAASRLTASYFGTSAIVLGAVGGSQSHSLTAPQLASHSHDIVISDPGHLHQYNVPTATLAVQTGSSALAWAASVSSTFTPTNTTGITALAGATGSGDGHNNVQPTLLMTLYMKL